MFSPHRIAIASALILVGLAATPSSQQAPSPGALAPSVAELRTEYAANPVGIDVVAPRLPD
jgi:hypothetical protein